jgi:hypothetical protein
VRATIKRKEQKMKAVCIGLGILGGLALFTVLTCMFLSVGKRADEEMQRYFAEQFPEKEKAEQKEGR